MDRDKLKGLYERGELERYFYRVANWSYHGKNGSFFKKYREQLEYQDDISIEIRLEDVLEDVKLSEFERLWIEVYLELDCNKTWVESRTGITRAAVARKINEIIDKCKKCKS
jgi:DNA-directed RNA polymerase specialized sigma subunit